MRDSQEPTGPQHQQPWVSARDTTRAAQPHAGPEEQLSGRLGSLGSPMGHQRRRPRRATGFRRERSDMHRRITVAQPGLSQGYPGRSAGVALCPEPLNPPSPPATHALTALPAGRQIRSSARRMGRRGPCEQPVRAGGSSTARRMRCALQGLQACPAAAAGPDVPERESPPGPLGPSTGSHRPTTTSGCRHDRGLPDALPRSPAQAAMHPRSRPVAPRQVSRSSAASGLLAGGGPGKAVCCRRRDSPSIGRLNAAVWWRGRRSAGNLLT
ncbi:hypothetical protein M432DRAFT_637403 [Thermoascus aurantiacus ATCC 26904]